MPFEGLTEEELTAIAVGAESATPGPWFVRFLDDDRAMNLTAVSTVPGTDWDRCWPDFSHENIVAATLVQHPRCVDSADGRWDENAAFIAMARDAVPRLVEEVRGLAQETRYR